MAPIAQLNEGHMARRKGIPIAQINDVSIIYLHML